VQGASKDDCVTEWAIPLGKKNVTTVPFGAVMLGGLYVSDWPEATSILICPGVLGGADGTFAGADTVPDEVLVSVYDSGDEPYPVLSGYDALLVSVSE